MQGVRFRLGVAGTALGLPAGELADETVPVAELWGDWVDERVAAGGMPALLDIVRERLRGVAIDPLARAAALGMAGPGARVDELGAALGVSERQLRRRFADAVGYGPKTLARVLRFQRFLALARSGDELARLALTRGLRRPGAPHARDAPARRAHAARARPRARDAGGRAARVTDSFKPPGARAPSVRTR